MARAFWAFVAFNIYSAIIFFGVIGSYRHLPDANLLPEIHTATGEAFDINYFIYRSFYSVVATAFAAFLTGAIAKENGAKLAAISNIPAILAMLGWMVMFYSMSFSDIKWYGQIGFLIGCLIAISLISGVAYIFGFLGEETQETYFSEGTVLGIQPYHWAWITFPMILYSHGIVYITANFLTILFITFHDISITANFILLFALIPLIAWVMPLVMTYQILTGKSLGDKSRFVKALANIGILTGGLLIAVAVLFACNWVLDKLNLLLH